jgi:exocyst complex component 4
MSGQNGYGHGYGYSGPGRYDANDAQSSSSLGVSGYSGRSAGASSGGRSDRRPGGYGGFYEDSSQPPALSPSQSRSPERRRDEPNHDRDRQQPSQASSRSRSRPREHDTKNLDERPRDQRHHADRRDQERNAFPVVKRSNTSGEAQAIESLCSFLDTYRGSMANKWDVCSDPAIDPTRLGLYDRCRVCSSTRCSESDGYEYIGQGGPRRGLHAHVQ